jgi:hypothetical protein
MENWIRCCSNLPPWSARVLFLGQQNENIYSRKPTQNKIEHQERNKRTLLDRQDVQNK